MADRRNPEHSTQSGRPGRAALDLAPASAELRRLRFEVSLAVALKLAALLAIYWLFFAQARAPAPNFDALGAAPGRSSPGG